MTIGTPANIGHNTGTTQVTSASVTTTGAIAAGDAIIVNISRQNVNAISGVTSVTDGSSNSYVSVVGHGDGGQNQYTEVWICKNATALGSGGTVTVNGLNLLASGPSWGISVWHVTGLDQTTPTDKTNSIDSNASPWATTAQTTTSANELLWVVVGGNQNEPTAIVNADCLPSSGWTQGDAITYGGNNGNVLRSAYQIVSATGSYKGGGTLTAGNAISATFASFVAAAGGGTVTGSSTMGTNAASGLASVVAQTENTFTAGGAGDLASVVNFPANSPMGGAGGLGAVLSQALASAFNLGMPGGGLALPTLYAGVITLSDVGGGLLAFSDALAQLSLGNAGAGLVVTAGLPVVGSVTMGMNDVGGLFPLNSDFEVGMNAGGGLSIPLAFVGDLNGQWVTVLVKIWRETFPGSGIGQWNIIPVKMWRIPGQWNNLST